MKASHWHFPKLALIIVLPLFVQFGCQSLYIHDDARQKIAENAKSNFDAIAQSPLGAETIDSMLALRGSVQDIVGSQGVEISYGGLLDRRWDDLSIATNQAISEVSDEQRKVAEAKKAAETRLADRLSELPGVQKKEAGLLDAMNEAAKAEARFAATQKFLATALSNVATTQPSTTISKIHDVLATTQPVTTFEAAGKNPTTSPSTQPFALKQSIDNKSNTVGALIGLPADLATTRPSVTTVKEGVQILLEKKFNLTLSDQGIKVTVISLFYDLARAEELRIDAEIAAAKEEMAAYDTQLSFLESLSKRLDEQKKLGVPAAAKPGERIRETLQRLCQNRAANNSADDMADTLYGLPLMFRDLYVDWPKVARLETQRTGFDVKRETALAVVRLEERSAIVSRGLDGLVAFETSGINKDDVTHLMQLLAAVELGIIAGK